MVLISTLLHICCPGFSGSVLQEIEKLEELPPKAVKGFPPPPPPEPAIDVVRIRRNCRTCRTFDCKLFGKRFEMQTYRTFAPLLASPARLALAQAIACIAFTVTLDLCSLFIIILQT